MNAYLLTWNPQNWHWKTLAQDASQTEKGVAITESWSCGNRKKIEIGDRLFLLKQGTELPRGIIASGKATSEVYRAKHWNAEKAAKGQMARYVEADWDTILDFNKETLLQTADIDYGTTSKMNWKTQSSGISISIPILNRLQSLWAKHIEQFRGIAQTTQEIAAIESELTDDGFFDPLDFKDERNRQLRGIVQRRGQPEFRNKLISASQGRCAITGCDAIDALEAAHIMPYKGPKSHHVTNGLLLRADIHTLFDLNFIGIDPATFKIALHPKLITTSINEYKDKKLTLPNNPKHYPNSEALKQRWKIFKSQLGPSATSSKL